MVFLILLLLTVRVRMAAMILNRPFRRAIYGKALSYGLMLNDPLTTNPPSPRTRSSSSSFRYRASDAALLHPTSYSPDSIFCSQRSLASPLLTP